MSESTKKIVLAYSGGLDTSVILRWLQDTYQAEVVTFTADIGQAEQVSLAHDKAAKLGVKEIFIEDLQEEFVRDYVFPMLRANTLYEGEYMLGTAIARPLIAKRLVEIAKQVNADSISHGATGKGNDQVRFEVSALALQPDIKIIAPWREWDLTSRDSLLAYCKKADIEVDFAQQKNKPPYSMDANALHISYEGGELEDPWCEPNDQMWRWTVDLEAAPDIPEYLEIGFDKGDACSVNGATLSPAKLLHSLNDLGAKHGVGRADIVENRYVGMKSRGCYETPGGSILLKAHRALESITIDREVCHLKDDLMPRYAKMIYSGYWFTPERMMLQQAIDASQVRVTGVVRIKLYKGNIVIVGRGSENSLFDADIATFNDDNNSYNQKDAEGFIKLSALRLAIAARKSN